MRACLHWLGLLVLAACTTSRDDINPSPIPPGVALRGDATAEAPALGTSEDVGGVRLDEVIAVVEGEPLSLRTMARRLGIPFQELGDEDHQREIEDETREWAKDRLIQKAAERAGLKIPAARVDLIVEDMMNKELERASEKVGHPVSRDEFLRSEGLTWDEWREKMGGRLVRGVYLDKLAVGIAGARPLIDMEVSPSEIRRVYREKSQAFDEAAGVRLARFEVVWDQFDNDERDNAEIGRLARAKAETIAADFRGGMQPEQIAQKHGLGEAGEHWAAMPEERWVTAELEPDPTLRRWYFEATRRPRDARIQIVPRRSHMVVGILEQRIARRIPYDEAYERIERGIQIGRRLRLEQDLILELLSKEQVVWPPSLHDSLAEQAHELLEEIRKEGMLDGARLK